MSCGVHFAINLPTLENEANGSSDNTYSNGNSPIGARGLPYPSVLAPVAQSNHSDNTGGSTSTSGHTSKSNSNGGL